MAISTKQELKDYCLRALGHPLVQIDITDEAMDDCVEYAIEFFNEYYFDGADRYFYSHQVTQQDIDNRYITIPDHIWGINMVYPLSGTSGIAGADAFMFDMQFQLRQTDMRSIANSSLVYYSQMMSHLALIDNLLAKQIQYRFNRNSDKCYIDANWNQIPLGAFLMLDCYTILDPTTNTKFWNNRLFKEYCVAKFKMQWAQAYKKFEQIQLPGGVTIDGQGLYAEAKSELDDLEQDMITNQTPMNFSVG